VLQTQEVSARNAKFGTRAPSSVAYVVATQSRPVGSWRTVFAANAGRRMLQKKRGTRLTEIYGHKMSSSVVTYATETRNLNMFFSPSTM